MEQIVVKTEVQNNGEILLYYVDENGESQQGIITTVENVENSGLQLQDNYILSNLEDYVDESSMQQVEMEQEYIENDWSDDDTKRLLIFYNDNKQVFTISGASQRKHLWSVACKTMLIGKDFVTCEVKLNELKAKYAEVQNYTEKGLYVKWPFLELCQQAFHDDTTKTVKVEDIKPKMAVLKQEIIETNNKVVKQINIKTDEKVEQMLNIYLKYKLKFQQEHWRKDLWDNIAMQLGEEEDGEYWHKRFLNYKQHYINLLIKQQENGPSVVNWPYLELFNKIFADDAAFNKKIFNTTPQVISEPESDAPFDTEHDWNTTYVTVLAKYYFDSYEEFEDPTIPNMFLWTEVGRLIDKKPETCKAKYAALRDEHLEKYIAGGYNLKSRTAIAIIFDHIINKDVKKVFSNANFADRLDWQEETTDAFVQFFLENIDVFKESVCYFVCFEAVAKKLNTDLESCKRQWDELVYLYNTILEDKKDEPEMQIDWRYIEMFDRIFDYGMDVALINGFNASIHNLEGSNVGVKRVHINSEKKQEPLEKLPHLDNQNLLTPRTDHRSTMILEFYLKNKDKFQHLKNKLSLWEPLTNDIGLNATQCSHRFRHLKQTFIDMIQKEIDQPKANITWPYFGLCKKVFGYRSIKNKLKQGIMASDDDWLARELKQLITFFSKNFDAINNSVDDLTKWSPLATELGKSSLSCKDKFVELRKCYRKLKTMKTRNPDVKISWSHFPMMDRVFAPREVEAMQVETFEEEHLDMDGLDLEGDEDYQCIIVLQDGQEISDVGDEQILIQNPGKTLQTALDQEILPEQPLRNFWTKRTKKLLLIHYINYMRSHRAKKIVQKHLWDEISSKIPNKTSVQCKKMFNKMKTAYKKMEEEKKRAHSLHSLMEKVLKIKPKVSITPMKDAKIHKTYKNVDMDPVKVENALTYYLNHIDDFVDPKFEKTYLWTELAKHISEPISKVYNKINYLKQAYNVETEEIDGQKTPWSGILNEIIVKEVSMNVLLEDTKPLFDDNESNWSEDQTERLLTWYLGNLDKFKNPKFNRSYLWMEASAILNKSPLVCSKKMTEIRTQYRNMVKNNVQELNNWRFLELCQKIYGTGKKSSDN